MANITQERPKRATPQKRTAQPVDRFRAGVMLFLAAALVSFFLSIGLWFSGSRQEGLYVGIWVPSILAAGSFWVSAMAARR